ncbi:MAG: hypothetical protein L0Y66_10690 [Myxococcaceae bacterium]|nr:hypothetical protein [Myxococcaceae bacterium]
MVRRTVALVHTTPGRTRLRLRWLRRSPEQAAALADHLSALPGMEEVVVRTFTGSVLCTHDPAQLLPERLLEEARRFSGEGVVVLGPGEAEPPDEEELLRAAAHGSNVARAFARFFKAVNLDVVRTFEGRVDLGTLASLFLLGAGTAEVVATRRLPMPPWFNLGWWAFRTFIVADKASIDSVHVLAGQPPEPTGAEAGASPEPHGPHH